MQVPDLLHTEISISGLGGKKSFLLFFQEYHVKEFYMQVPDLFHTEISISGLGGKKSFLTPSHSVLSYTEQVPTSLPRGIYYFRFSYASSSDFDLPILFSFIFNNYLI
ncbi:Hypothetical predicted protein [Olea europaea subsp. europaea]|uniref:Uncharacterized protein n=1 Tax=Olea europaea subsp. europaea TaxID=158383 RepID=A0A8S0U1U1_OLEEU|nr:Hypothetical predicted protein [Olea europaea subsp. europaea]